MIEKYIYIRLIGSLNVHLFLNSFNIVDVPVHTCEILLQMQLEALHSEPAGL